MATAAKPKRRGRTSKGRNGKRLRGRRELLFSALPELRQSFSERELLIYSSAVAFQILSSIVPFVLFCIAAMGFFHLQDVWTNDIASHIKPHVSKAGFTLINDTAHKVLGQQQVWWVTGGFALAIWEISGGIRGVMRGLDRIYEARDSRHWLERGAISVALALVLLVCVLAATAVVWAGPLLYGDVGQPLGALLAAFRWVVAAVLLGLAVGVILRFAPDEPQPVGWVSFGTCVMVGAWILTSILFGLYVRFVASYGSIFGSLATVVVAIAYIYLSTTAFFVGAQIDAIVRRRVEGNPSGT